MAPDPVKMGQELKVMLGAAGEGDWHVALFVEDPAGEVVQLLPNRLTPDLLLKSGQPQPFPPVGATFELLADGPAGEHTALMLVTRQAPVLSGISEYRGSQKAFASVTPQGQGALASLIRVKLQALNGESGVQLAKFKVVAP